MQVNAVECPLKCGWAMAGMDLLGYRRIERDSEEKERRSAIQKRIFEG